MHGSSGQARSQKANRDLAGKDHWDNTERNIEVDLHAVAPSGGVRNYAKRRWHDAFELTFGHMRGQHKRLLELGCGGSAFLPYLAREFGFDVSGVDYSENGCSLARRMCEVNGVQATIVCADFFESPAELAGSFDAVVSFGVVEHFSDTAKTLACFSRFLKPGGMLLTVVPNMRGVVGAAQKMLCRAVFDIHESVTPERLDEAHRAAGLTIVRNEYFLFANFGVINPGERPTPLRRAAFGVLKAATGLVWAVESLAGPFRPNRTTSPYIWCVALVADPHV
jgi:2-polyprenyl-3-methyl-5-hydroxy-6-metoxy-1,4-benzoquinol methylase